MPQTVQPRQILDPGESLRNKALYVNWEEEFWEKFHSKHKQVFGEVKEMHHPEPKEVKEVFFFNNVSICIECICFLLEFVWFVDPRLLGLYPLSIITKKKKKKCS